MFHDGFPLLLDHYNLKMDIIIHGNVNIHFESADNPNTKRARLVLDDRNLEQFVKTPTHRSAHIPDWIVARPSEGDWIVARPSEGLITSIDVTNDIESYHSAVTATVALWLRRPPRERGGSIPGRVIPKTLKLAF